MKEIIALSVLISLLFCNFVKVDTYELGDDVVATSSYRVKSKKYVISGTYTAKKYSHVDFDAKPYY